MPTKPALRLSRLIASETGKDGIKLNRLTALINEANREAGTNCYVNRRMLANIRDNPGKIGLTLNGLIAFNTNIGNCDFAFLLSSRDYRRGKQHPHE